MDTARNSKPVSQPKRILVIEDDSLIAMMIEDILVDLGHEVVGPAVRPEAALRLADEEDVDHAIVDVNLSGSSSAPVAQVLARRGIPIVLATIYPDLRIGTDIPTSAVLPKPFSLKQLVDTLEVAQQSCASRET